MLSPVDSSASAAATQSLPQQYEPAPSLPTAAERAPVSEGVGRMLQAANDNAQAAPAPTERTLVTSEDSVQAGGVRDAYDMQLYQETDGSYTLELNMKVGMDFVEGPQGQQWTPDAQEQFKRDFAQVIEGSWSGHQFTSDTGSRSRWT